MNRTGTLKYLLFGIAVIFFAVPEILAASSVTGPKFLTLHYSPKVNSLGGSYTALFNDIDAIEENPAGTVFAQTFNMNVVFTKWISDINYFNIKAVVPLAVNRLHGKPAVPFNLLLVSSLVLYPGVRHFDDFGNPQETVQLLEGFSGAGLSTTFFNFLNVGTLIKFIYRNINNVSYPAMTIDLGFQTPYLLKFSVLNFAAGLKNIGYDFNNNMIPSEVYFGVSKDFISGSLVCKLDLGSTGLSQPGLFMDEAYISFGVEYSIRDILILRGGLKYAQQTVFPTVGLGSGLKLLNSLNLYMILDYAYIPRLMIDEFNNHQISIGLRLYTQTEIKENGLFFESYERKGNLAYLKGNIEEAVKYWEQALRYKKSDLVQKKVDQTKVLIEEKKKRKTE
jgi:hypothetical protein